MFSQEEIVHQHAERAVIVTVTDDGFLPGHATLLVSGE